MGRHAAALTLPAALLLLIAGAFAAHAGEPGPPAATNAPPADQLQELDIIGERPGPRLWKVSKGDHVLWLLGTLTHIPKRMTWRSGEVDSVLGQAEELLVSGPSVSANLGPISAIKLYFQWRRTQKIPDRATLRQWLPAPLYARFEALKARYDAHDSGIEDLRPSFAALRLYEQAVDAAGLTQRDDVEEAVIRLAKRRGVPITRATLKVPDPSGTLKEVGELPPSVEVGCLDATVTRIETDLPTMQDRARAWAVGDVERLRTLSFTNQREACLSALSNAPRVKALVDSAAQAWNDEAESALSRHRVSLGMRPIYDLLSADGALARFRAEGYRVEGP
jgi:uncharacterized protein YbaP (TraB family)